MALTAESVNNFTSIASSIGSNVVPMLSTATDLIKGITTMFAGRAYTTGQYVLGERYLDHIAGEKPDYGRGDVKDEVVLTATLFFTFAFGVRITTSEDLDALDSGASVYYARPEKSDIPRNAVERAVALKKKYYPIATYNKGKWNTEYLFNTPFVAPIPGIAYRTLMEARLSDTIIVKQGIIQGLPASPTVTPPSLGFSGMPEKITSVNGDEEAFRNGEVQERESVTFTYTIKKYLRAYPFLKTVLELLLLLPVGVYMYEIPRNKRRKK